ncbi:MAG: YraN family protein [Desulfovibrionaceae bacterium]
MPARHLILGRSGEDAAARHLESKGYRIIERNWTEDRLELDLVCEKGDMLVFVEVKTRGRGSRGTPADGLSAAKRSKLVRAAARYLSRKGRWQCSCRFDFAAVTPCEESFSVEYQEDAFRLDDVPGVQRLWQPF